VKTRCILVFYLCDEKSEEDATLKVKDKYIIHADSLALLPYFNEDGDLFTIVIERNRHFQIRKSPKRIILDNCHFHGYTLKEKLAAAREVLLQQHTPVCISAYFKLCFFPSKSIEAEDCYWFSQRGVKQITPHERGCVIVLVNGKKILIEKSPKQLAQQFKNATDLLYSFGAWQDKLGIRPYIAEDHSSYEDTNDNSKEDDSEW